MDGLLAVCAARQRDRKQCINGGGWRHSQPAGFFSGAASRRDGAPGPGAPFKPLSLCVCVCGGLFIKNCAQSVTIKAEAQAIVLRKQRNFWFALIAVGPNAAEFFLVNSAVFCCFQFTLNLSQQFSHLPPPQLLSKSLLIPKSGGELVVCSN